MKYKNIHEDYNETLLLIYILHVKIDDFVNALFYLKKKKKKKRKIGEEL